MSRRHTRGRRVAGVTAAGAAVPFDPMSLSPWSLHSDTVDTATAFDWLDQTGNGRHYRQTTAAAKPTFVTGVVNGQPVVRFDGVDDYLDSVAAASAFTFLHNGTGSDVFAVVVPRTLAAGKSILDDYTGGAQPAFRILTGAASTTARLLIQDNAGAFAAESNVASAFALDAPVLIEASFVDGGTPEWDFRIDNTSGGSGSAVPGTSAPPATMRVGARPNGSSFANYDFAYLLTFARVLDASERALVKDYIAVRFGISVA